MPDPDTSPPLKAVTRAESYLSEALPATPSLGGILRQRIEHEGPIRFADFMASALYEPRLGYYARETRQVGRSGDFFTSVSVGPLFGELLARRFLHEWRESGSPTKWRIIECGAHDGTLAADILGAISSLHPLAWAALEYVIPEPLPLLQSAQKQSLSSFQKHVRFITNIDEIHSQPLPGIAFGNELLDALPFHVVEMHPDGWRECRVGMDPSGGFVWETDHPIADPLLSDALTLLGIQFPIGYRTEVRTNYRSFLQPLTRALSSGLLLWPDYGFARPEYYDPNRRSGTLRTFSKHRAAENPLETPGEIDITAHVDFTAVAEAAIDLGCLPATFRHQGAWLTEIGRDWLLSLEGNPDATALRQFQTLTHPVHLGGSFHVLELSWNQAAAPVTTPETWHRLGISPP